MAEVANEKIRQPAVAEVTPCSAEAGPWRDEPHCRGHLGEGAIAVVVEEAVRDLAVEEATQVVDDEEIEIPVAVVVDPGGGKGRPPYAQPRFLGDVREGPVTVVAHQLARAVKEAEARNKQIR